MSVRIFHATLLLASLAWAGFAVAQDATQGPVSESDRYEELDLLEGEPAQPNEDYDSYAADPDESSVSEEQPEQPRIAVAPPVDNYFDEPAPRRAVRDRIGTCKQFEQTVMIDGRERPAYGTACLQPDGAWKIVKAAAPVPPPAPRYRETPRPRPYWDDYDYTPRERWRWRAY